MWWSQSQTTLPFNSSILCNKPLLGSSPLRNASTSAIEFLCERMCTKRRHDSHSLFFPYHSLWDCWCLSLDVQMALTASWHFWLRSGNWSRIRDFKSSVTYKRLSEDNNKVSQDFCCCMIFFHTGSPYQALQKELKNLEENLLAYPANSVPWTPEKKETEEKKGHVVVVWHPRREIGRMCVSFDSYLGHEDTMTT